VFSGRNLQCRSCGEALKARGLGWLYAFVVISLAFMRFLIFTKTEAIFFNLVAAFIVVFIIYSVMREIIVKYELAQ